MRILLYLIVFVIIYGSYYPFHFQWGVDIEVSMWKLFNFNFLNSSVSDLISNTVLFIPFGLVLSKAYRTQLTIRYICQYLIIGFALAFIIQVGQIWTIDRIPWGGDAIWNLFGCLIGIVLAKVSTSNRIHFSHGLSPYLAISFYLGLALIFIKLAPYSPALDFDVLKTNLKQIIDHPQIDWFWIYESVVTWLIAFYLLSQAKLKWLTTDKLVVMVFAVLSVKFLIINNNINISQFVGASVALVLWVILKPLVNKQLLLLALVLTIILNGLYPFELKPSPSDFHWLPFTGSLNGNILLNIIAMSKKMLFYISAVWLMYLWTNKLRLSTITLAIVIFIGEYSQRFFTNSVAEITDAILVLLGGYILSLCLMKSATDAQNIAQTDPDYTKASNANLSQGKFVGIRQREIIGLDGLRAFAALSVFIVHFQQFTNIGGTFGPFDFEQWMVNGNTGVALFFALSGFLLSIPFWQAKQELTLPNIKHYFFKRAIRIIPLFYLCFILLMALKGFKGAEVNFNNILSHLFFLHNLKDYQVMSLNPPFWSLAVEMQFYLLLPLFFILIKKLNRESGTLVFVVLVPVIYILYRLLMNWLGEWNSWPIRIPLIWPFGIELESVNGAALKYSTMAHLPHFLIGVVAASLFLTYRDSGKQKPIFCESLFWLASISVAVILSTPLDELFQLNYGRYNFPLVPLLLGVILVTAPNSMFAKRILDLPILRWVGIISFGVYLFHYPLLKATKMAFDLAGLSVKTNVVLYGVSSLMLTLLLAHLSYKYFESPVMRIFTKEKSFMSDMPTKQATSQTNRSKMPRLSIYKMGGGIVLIMGIVGLLYILNNQNTTKVNSMRWASNNANIIFDHHTHTQYSDGSLTLNELTELAFSNGCNALAITDHTDSQSSFNPEKVAKVNLLRNQYPNLLILNGVELGMPDYKQREHVNIITTPEFESSVLPEVFAKLNKSYKLPESIRDRFIFDNIFKSDDEFNHSFAIYNHPSRKDETADENLSDIKNWNANRQNIMAISGAPGHQKSPDIGSYRDFFKTIDRWDPAIAQVGSTLDQLLDEGYDIWGAIASSDYHNEKMDYPPCGFSRIHVSAAEKTYAGLMTALKKGTFWASHGKFLSQFKLVAEVSEKQLRLSPGEAANVDAGSIALIQVELLREADYIGLPLGIELITNCVTGEPELLGVIRVAAFENTAEALIPINREGKDVQSCYLRSRVRVEVEDGATYMAYSNHIRFLVN
jgi:peptidoglycan/LPS O-acetylase OafA/YrhL/glycopeptide antibiotics resistance protein